MEKRPFESACIKFFSGSESVFASNEGNGKKIKENYAMNIFDFQNSEIHKDQPIYDKNSYELEEQPFESTCTEVFSSRLKYDIYGDSESDDVWSPNQCTVCLFEQQFPKSRKLISFIPEI